MARENRIDAIKGLLIILVILGHTIIALDNENIINHGVMGLIYIFHDQKNVPCAFALVSADAVKGMRVVYPERAATIIFVGQSNTSVFHWLTVSL